MLPRPLRYDERHRAFEENFWATKMGLAGASKEALVRTNGEYEDFLADEGNLQAVVAALQADAGEVAEGDRRALEIAQRTFECYQMPAEARPLKEALLKEGAVLEGDVRGAMKLGYINPADGEFVQASSVQLRNLMRTAADEKERRACYEGLRTIGPHVAEQFCKVVKMRNQLAKALGHEDFYQYKVLAAEGFGKDTLFEMLDSLEERTRPIMEAARKRLAEDKGDDALQPWNISQALSGESAKLKDPYFPFAGAVSAWGRSFAALGIKYRQATMRLDLLDRQGKYSNGFCHWPQCAYVRPDGSWQPSTTNFTSLATPGAIGSGETALTTLMHEGGHAAHFANVVQPSPMFSQERAPMSVAYAENQSMVLDSLCGDAAWLARYARDADDKPMPFEVVEKAMRDSKPYAVLALRGMIAVPYFEKALYELPDEEVTPARVMALADEVEAKVQGGLSPRPLLSVPHLLSDEASCYYHGYVLAEMAVWQTRKHFKDKYGYLVDNPQVGADLSEVYWHPGNSESFLSLVQKLTGAPLSSDAWVEELQEDLEGCVERERAEYEAAIAKGPAVASADVDLDMRMLLAHGDLVIADTEKDGGFEGAAAKFKKWLDTEYEGNA